MIDFVFPLFGRFHPILVHLPIGFLAFGIILVFLSKKGENKHLDSIRLAYLLGAIAAVLSSISGFLQYQYEGFSWESVQFHFYFGCTTALFSFYLFYEINKYNSITSFYKLKSGALFALMLFTGHLGGNITHGETYLIEPLPAEVQNFLGYETTANKGLEIPEIGWEELVYYEDVVQPILNQNCSSCHNSRNKKGNLDLSEYNALLKGGEDGLVLTGGNPEQSSLFTRLVLPKEDDDHMPPKEKRQLHSEEIELIKHWISLGGTTESKLGDAGIEPELLEPFIKKEETPFYPTTAVSSVPEDNLNVLKESGFFAEPISEESNWIMISCINLSSFSDADWEKLNPVKEQLAFLDLSRTQITDQSLDELVGFPNLTVLKLNETGISGEGLEKLLKNENLKNLYLNKTQVTLEHLESLRNHPGLEKVFVFDTPASGNELAGEFSFYLERGNYLLPKLATDTIVY
ncbi:c-type cytochrome domain-containing protein [Algoriphagus vanfongensis]|uniref:c-type cytochrome domain-containing protein n=1 Tax=Algoriphagus vanfongensis TaxID=426371 RepID=UPI00042171CA|nr:c-type cytochrome domain-containing protein [Algoriphagus vanfongensis]